MIPRMIPPNAWPMIKSYATLGAVVAAALLLGVSAARGQATAAAPAMPGGDQKVNISTAWSASGVKPGGRIVLAVVMDVAEGWHVQLHQPELDWLVATEVTLESPPPGVVFGDVQWPQPHPIKVNFTGEPQTLHFYASEAVVYLKVSVSENVEPGEYPLDVRVRWQACDDRTCLPPQTAVKTAMLNVVPAGAAVHDTNEELFAAYEGGGAAAPGSSLRIPFFGWDFTIDPTKLWVLLPITAIGGLLLNFTPCVLPLVPIKIMGLSQAAAGSRGRCMLLGGMMALGVMGFWLALGAVVSSVSWFTSTNQLFQYPWFTITIGAVIAVMAIGMCGLFTMRLPQWVYRINPRHDTLHGSLGFGVMAAVLSTPCTAPMMGATAGWAAGQTPSITLATFGAVGLGMALPYAVLSAFPALVDRMPRSGAAGELIKQVMGLLLLAAAVFFLGAGVSSVLRTPPDPTSRAYWWAVAACIIVAGTWLAWRTWRITPAAGRRAIFVGLGLAFIATGAWLGLRMTDRGPVDWIHYTPQRLAEARQSDKTVVLEFTAEWCANCHYLERTVLNEPRVASALNRESTAPIKVDITGNNPEGNRLLREMGRRSIPLLVIYGPDDQQLLKSEAYTEGQVLDALERPPTPQAADAAN